jgi:predicted nucleic acid-binding protein
VNPPLTVSNSSPLIALAQIGHLELLGKLFSYVIVPPVVVRETTSVVLPPWILETPLTQPIGPRILGASLGRGESEAMSLALEINAQWIVLDDRPARRLAEILGLPVIGTLGILLAGKSLSEKPSQRCIRRKNPPASRFASVGPFAKGGSEGAAERGICRVRRSKRMRSYSDSL